MADALLIFGILTGIVLAATWMSWDLDIQVRREVRHGRVTADRLARQPEDQAYAEFWEQARQRADEIQAVLDRQPVEAVERLIGLMDERPRLGLVK